LFTNEEVEMPRKPSAAKGTGQKADEVYHNLRRAILEGRYLPAQHLVEQAIADSLKTSKTPVREALARLREDGLVESFKFRGYFIKTLSADDLEEIYELRELYEGACVRAAAESDGHDEVALRLAEANQAAARAFEDGDVDVVYECFARFDDILFDQTQNRRLREEVERIGTLILLGGALTNQIPGRIQKSIGQHEAIIDAVAAGAAEEAEALTRAHIRSLLEDELARRRGSSIAIRSPG
jgi:DNA-binding GntR family transcriptional regulator